MARFNVFLCLSLQILFLISCSGTRLFHPFSVSDQTLEEEAKARNKVELIAKHFESEQFSGMGDLALAVETKEHPKTVIERQKVNEKKQESKQFPSISKRTLMIEEAKEAISASIRRNDGIPYDSERLSPGGPDPHHH